LGKILGKEIILILFSLLQISPRTLTCCGFFLGWSAMTSPFFFVRWRKEKERGQAENDEQTLAFWKSGGLSL